MSVISRKNTELPQELIREVLKFVDCKCLSAVAQVSKIWQRNAPILFSAQIDKWMGSLHSFLKNGYGVIGENNVNLKLDKFIESFYGAGPNFRTLKTNDSRFKAFTEKYRARIETVKKAVVPRSIQLSLPAPRASTKRKLFDVED
jgi:hypothetical protein